MTASYNVAQRLNLKYSLSLTHWGRVTHICVDNLSIIGSDNGSNIVNWTLRNNLHGNLNQNSCVFIHENAFENVVWKMVAILSRPQCVNVCVLSRKCSDFRGAPIHNAPSAENEIRISLWQNIKYTSISTWCNKDKWGIKLVDYLGMANSIQNHVFKFYITL